jgi:sortase A
VRSADRPPALAGSTRRGGGARLATVAAVLGLALGAAACGGPARPDHEAVAVTPVADAPSRATTPPLAVLPVVLPIPAAPPEPNAPEPVVELGTIDIPKLGLHLTMSEGVSLTTLARGPGHWPGTAMPGEIGNVVVAGHRVTNTRPFRDIDQLGPGDEVIFEVAGVRHVYRMVASEIVDPSAMRVIDQTPARTATLFACHPPGSARYRYIVDLELAP